jgi:mannose-1-phosphate guanylyltransferase
LSKPRLRALVLAAGKGTRLAPLTAFLPKPLLPVCGRPLVEHTLERLAAAGCEAAALNLHHLGEQIRGHLGDEYRGMPLVYSEERPERLGTLGALHPLRDFLAEADVVLLVNGDSLCRWPLPRLVRRHLATGAAATLLLAGRVDPDGYGGGVAVDKEGRILAFSRGETPRGTVAARHVFAGAHALSPELLERVADRPADIVRQLYRPLLAEGARLEAQVTRRSWHDLGTPRRYLEGAVDWAHGPWWRWPRRSWKGPGVEIGRRVRLSAAVVEGGAAVESGARIGRSVVMAGARVGAGAEVRETIVGPGVELPERARILRQVVVVARRGLPGTEGDSHLDGLVYSPLDAPRRDGNPGL